MPTPAMQKLVAEQIAYERIIQAICDYRADLSPGEVKTRIQRLAESTTDSQHSWAIYCQERARQTRPMPWEDAEG